MKQSAPSSGSHEEKVIPASSLQWGSMDSAGALKGALEGGPGTFRLEEQILPPLHVASGAPLKTIITQWTLEAPPLKSFSGGEGIKALAKVEQQAEPILLIAFPHTSIAHYKYAKECLLNLPTHQATSCVALCCPIQGMQCVEAFPEQPLTHGQLNHWCKKMKNCFYFYYS